MTKPRQAYKEQAQNLEALAHESRLLIIDRLAQGDCTAGPSLLEHLHSAGEEAGHATRRLRRR